MSKLSSFFSPRSVAVIGASNTPGKVGYSLMRNLLESKYVGKILPINPKEPEILGVPCFKSVSTVGEPVDLAVVAIPAAAVIGIAKECGEAGVKHLIVITAGFKEIGSEGAKLEKELVSVCSQYGMSLLGPNCLGTMDTHTPINASFAGLFPPKGDIAFISQSGAICSAILDWAVERKLGFSKFISLGNKAGLNETDFIEDAAEDPYTKVILCYIESVTDGPRFIQIAKEASLKKPVILLKSGTSEAGARAASSHTGALAGNDRTYETVFKQCGLLRVKNMEELFSLATVFTTQPLPAGDRVAILTNAGGPGIIAADNVESAGLTMARFTKETVQMLRAKLPAESNLYNPVDVIGDARADRYEFALRHVLDDPNVDNVVVLLTPQAVTEPTPTAEAILRVIGGHLSKPVVTSFMGGVTVRDGVQMLEHAGIPSYPFAEPAIASVASLVRYANYRRSASKDAPTPLEVNKDAVKTMFAKVRADDRTVLLGSEAAQVAADYGVPVAPSGLATSASEAALMAEQFGYPVVLKIASPKILHKTDIGGVRLGLKSAQEVHDAFVEITDNAHRFMPQVTPHGVEVQKMMPKGNELIIGMNRDHVFGPLVMFGMGGIYVNLLKDVSFRLADGITPRQAREMIQETKAYTLLRGFRGEAPADIEAVIGSILRVARLCVDFPEISELDINPLFAYEKGAAALDVKITIS